MNKNNRQLLEGKIEVLNKASKAYYVDGQEIMSNLEYDKLYDELEALEKKSGIVLGNSPTQNVGYQVQTSLPKEAHSQAMLSLDKTKDVTTLESFAGDHPCILSWKLDGLTIVLTYRNGHLFKAITRGNGEIGEVVTNNARTFTNLPLKISCKKEVILRGEAIISYSQFEKINRELPEMEATYKNPRNLCSGSVRQLNNEITAKRGIRFIAFTLVSGEGETRSEQYRWMEEEGFEVVGHRVVDRSNLKKAVEEFSREIEANDYPSDGLVLCYDNISYGKSLGETAKFPKDAIAFKWEDEIKRTTLEYIHWSPSRTGLINPVAVFSSVTIEGTTVERASVHNVSILRELELSKGDEIGVYKANMIIPQIEENYTRRGKVEIPETCPVCGRPTTLEKEKQVEVLFCKNPLCPAKIYKQFSLLVSRNGLNIEGLSQATIEKFVEEKILREPVDLFHLKNYREKIQTMEGFGEKSYENLISAVNSGRRTTPERLLYGLGINGVGVATGKIISKHCKGEWEKIMDLTLEELCSIEGIGDVVGTAYVEFFQKKETREKVQALVKELEWIKPHKEETALEGLTFVITGSLEAFKNREELRARIEDLGGKVSGSVTNKTSYLINNDKESLSSKNKKAKELGIKILSEKDFIDTFEGNQDA